MTGSDLEDLKALIDQLVDHDFRVGSPLCLKAAAALTAQAAEIERLTKERDAEALSADKFREVWSRADRHRQEVETERDALKAENQKLREALLAAKDALSASSFIYFQHAPNDSWRSGYKRDMGKIDAALQSGEER